MQRRKTKAKSEENFEEKKSEKKPLKLEKSDFKTIKFKHNQLAYFKAIKNSFVTVCTGPAGTAKTFVACYAALDLLREGLHKKIILARPAVESGENLGFIPGTIDEKIGPYMKGYTSNIDKILNTPEKFMELKARGIITMEPIAFMRSQTFDDTILILDEAQNSDLRQLMLAVTRLGENSKMIICGDMTQWDLKTRKKDLFIFNEHILKGVDKCTHFQFTKEDIVRHPLLIQLTDNYEKYKEANSLD